MSFTEAIALTSPLGFAIAGFAVLLAGFLRGFVGFGAALIAIPILSLVFAPAIAMPIAFFSGLPSMLQLLPTAIRHGERRIILPFSIGAFLAAPIGTWLLVITAPEILKMIIAVLVILMAAFLHQGGRLSGTPGPKAIFGAGGFAGLIQGVAGVGGPPAVAIALARPGTPTTQRANVIGAVSALSLSTVIPLWIYGLFTPEVLWLSLFLAPLHSGAALLGARFFAKGGQRHFRIAALATLAIIGVVTLIAAVQDYLAVN
jgi:uncharacterized membrane protein YfcA